MALQVKVTGPGGFTSDAGYRRWTGLQVDPLNKTVLIGVADYRDAVRRKEAPNDFVNQRAYPIISQERRAAEDVEKDLVTGELVKNPDGTPVVHKIDHIPSFDQFLGQPLSGLIEGYTGPATLGDVLGKLVYGYMKTRSENAGATDV